MEPGLIAMLVTLLLLAVAGMPIAFAILGSVLVYFLMVDVPSEIMAQRVVASLDSFAALAIPLFILAGTAMTRGGIADRLLGLAGVLVGHFKGGLAQVNVLNSLFIGGMSGSAKADSAIDAKLIVPVMLRHGYGLGFSSALSAASSVISPMLPPSIGLILYGLLAGVSIGKLFLAGVVPAFLVALSLMLTARWVSIRKGFGQQHQSRPSLQSVAMNFRRAWLALLMPVLIIVGLRMGVFTPTELGALVAVYALVIGFFVYREVTGVRGLADVLTESAMLAASIMLIIAAAGAFGFVLTRERVPAQVIELVTALSDNTLVLLLAINLTLLVLGLLMESTSLLIILTPILAPLGVALGVDPVQFGVVLVLNLVIGGVTPPVGGNLYTVCAITGCSIEEFSKSVLPFLGALVVVLLLVTYVPWITLMLPGLLMP